MNRIAVLPAEVRDKIAAGEVILRPNSVIKELVENALDARAQRLEVEIEDGGKKKCLVNDNGIGMSRDDALLAVERYATSKIATVDDIDRIRTYGFRGEALASIRQVSFFELETSNGIQGTRIEISGGEIKGIFDSHRTMGTRIKVTGLFFNLPARSKFLKSSDWERRLIIETVRVYALISFPVAFSLSESDRLLINLPMAATLLQRLQSVYPRSLTAQLTPVKHTVGGIAFNGYCTRSEFQERHSLNYLYVNFRPIKHPRIYHTIMEVFGRPKNPPAYLINIILDPALVDVNVHPAKAEVRFKDERYLCDLLAQVLKQQVTGRSTRVEPATPVGTPVTPSAPFREPTLIQETLPVYPTPAAAEVSIPGHDGGEFWQLHATYILAQTKSGMIMVDQHVAHERIIFETLLRSRRQTQRLLFPITLDLNPEEYETFRATKDLLLELGVEFKEFSGRTVVIDGLPPDFRASREDLKDFFSEIAGLGELMKQKEAVAKVVACKGAVKAGQKLSVPEMQSLIDQLFACENPYICPHGRPIVIKFSLADLAARFGR
jgi:DNA mismatch repair protein MutL